MPRRQKSEGQAQQPASAAPSPEAEPVGAVSLTPDDATAPKSSQARISVPLNDDGGIDISGLRSSTVEKFREAIRKTPDLFPADSGVKSWVLADCKHAYRILGEVEKWIAETAGVDPQSAEIWEFSENEIEELADPTVAVLNKYLGGIAGPEAQLLLALGGIHLQKYIAFRVAMATKAPRVVVMEKKSTSGNPVPGVNQPGETVAAGSETWQVR